MRKAFFIKLWVYLAPFVVIAGYILAVSWQLGEAMPMEQVITRQVHAEPILYLPAWGRADALRYKFLSVLAHDPQLLILGSSRSFEFQSYFATRQPDAFYNSAIILMNPIEMATLVQALSEENALPELMILLLDFSPFNGGTGNPAEDGYLLDAPYFREYQQGNQIVIDPHITTDPFTEALRISTGVREVAQLFARRSPLLAHEWDDGVMRLGLSSLNDFGYRNDGSFYQHNPANQVENQRRAHDYLVQNRLEYYQAGTVVRADMLHAVETIFQIMNGRIITVIMPYATGISQAFRTEPDYAYVRETLSALENLTTRYDVPFYPYLVPDVVGGTGAEMVDGMHASELLTLRVFARLAESQSVILDSYTDAVELRQIINNAQSPFHVLRESPYPTDANHP